MSTFIEVFKKNTKTEWSICLIGICVSAFLFASEIIPRLITETLFQGFASACLLYTIFIKKHPMQTKSHLIEAMFGGAFIWMFIESCSKLFAKWAVWRFF